MTSFSKRSKKIVQSMLVFSMLSSPFVMIQASADAGGTTQPVIDARVKNVLMIDGKSYKDSNGNNVLDAYENWELTTADRVADLIPRMSLAEKAGLMQITSNPNATTVDDFIKNRNLRYFILRDNPTAFNIATRNNTYQQIAEGTPLGIPIVFTSNPRNYIAESLQFGFQEASGQFSIWPGALGMAATQDQALNRDFAEIAREEWRASGIRKIYGSTVEVVTEPRWRRISESFGESPELNAMIATELVKGFQGEEINSESVVHTVKHFPGDGPVLRGLDPHLPHGKYTLYPTPGSLFQYQLPPFQAAIDAGANSIMSFYNVPNNEMSADQLPKDLWVSDTQQFEEVAGAYNKAIITDLLRTKMGFKGYVNSDSGVLTGMAYGVEHLSIEEKFAKAIRAGTSIFSDNNNPAGLISAVSTGVLAEEELTPHLTLLLTEIFNLGLFENPYVDPDAAQAIADSSANQARADEAHRKSVTLLRNNEGMLPLTDADLATTKLYVEVFNGTSSAAQTTSLKALIAKEDPSVKIVDTLEEATAALVWVRPRAFEYPDLSTVEIQLNELTRVDVAKVKQIEAAVPTALVINMTNPWVINEIEPGAAAVVATYNVKSEALLDVLRGRFNPTGKLPITIPANQEAVLNNAPDVPGYAEAFDYTYTNAVGDDYTFGFGLSYNQIETSLTGKIAVMEGTTFSLNYGLSNVAKGATGGIAAQELTLNFDPEQYEFVAATPLKLGLNIASQKLIEPGKVKILLASLGSDNVINTDGDLLRIQLKAKTNIVSPNAIALSNIVVSDGNGETMQLPNASRGYFSPDFNNSGKVDIGDLGMIAVAYGKNSDGADWAKYELFDLKDDGKIDIVDIATLAKQIN
ncbi:glycoside hydrolase family 3 N-terminal domain-containing protein [Paenibacillus sp. LHD-38]|uniref:glycoside hydrolase family 3 N-terminal domain-containing protein n=1 Tax=Paenibacillus sp. LHD-38 TaxID=3072143 RepID=UPI00280C80CC|nr:glycoside hydrolase family 3 N-terminal domain-containing protein [Paenibacillus sp. LHD-38]MDQ8737252.1 glycoside hydrolase family 3 N-terminal domain-containing protein [Paenibacillus sp. LHD-38]